MILDDVANDLVVALFPHFTGVRVDRVATAARWVRFDVAGRDPVADCPACGRSSDHSRYERTVADRGLGDREVLIRLRVRRFRCRNDDCARRIFAEPIVGLTQRYQRRNPPLTSLLVDVALALGGRAGARLTRRLLVDASHMTLLRLLRALPVPDPGQLCEVGVDDFALRRGHHYGTVLVDMRTHRPVDLLPDRTADTVAAWLARHPGIRVVCRDRAGAYADGAARGAPQAIQVADRWHLWHNLGQAAERVVARHRAAIQPTDPTATPAPPSRSEGSVAPPGSRPPAPADRQDRTAQRTRDRFRQVHDLLEQGTGLRGIATKLRLSRGTVRRFARAETAEQLLVNNGTGYRTSMLEPHKPYLHMRWEAGATNATHLHAELTARGYTGGFTIVRDYIHRLRNTPGHVRPPAPTPPTVRKVTTWLMTDPPPLILTLAMTWTRSSIAVLNSPPSPTTSAGSPT
ncbi:ISL3 family transposase [Actinokineospora sp. UTMC 2448]|uniref:ISL3 family transposase n=1 Tax=Actinokineospora sp. UTMC 2448 TaxID=2268449 RepID=UPI002164843F|nr:ISL3 family transposase [Actinokineospora sp. UTMC 2448]